MPVITYQTVEGALSPRQKEDLSQALNQAVAQVLGEKIQKNAWVLINELPEGNFSIGGHQISAQNLKSLMKEA